MKILFIHPSVELYGADKILLYILELMKEDNEITVLLPKQGILVDFIANISSKINIIIDDGIPIVHSKFGLKNFIKLPYTIKRISKLFPYNSFDLLYCNTLATICLLFTRWSRKKIMHVHEIIENRILNLGFSTLLKWNTKNVICVSEHVKKNLLFSKNYVVIHNGIPDLSEETKIESDNGFLKFVLPGRFMQKKGQWFLIETLKKMSKEYLCKCKFYFFGSPPPNRMSLGEDLKTEIMNNNLQEYIEIHDFTQKLDDIYLFADVILVPSIMRDPFPTTVLEAMMFAKPIIATNNGGASEIINKSFGRLITPNNYDEFLESLLFFIDNKEKIQSMGTEARKKYEDYLTIDCFKKRFINYIKELMGDE